MYTKKLFGIKKIISQKQQKLIKKEISNEV